AFFFLLRDGLLPYTPDRGVMTWCHVGDVVAAHEAAADRGSSGAGYILGGPQAGLHEVLEQMAACLGIPFTTRRLPCELLRRHAQRQVEIAAVLGTASVYTPDIVDVFAEDYRCDDSRAQRELGYRSGSLRDMVADAHAWLSGEGLL